MRTTKAAVARSESDFFVEQLSCTIGTRTHTHIYICCASPLCDLHVYCFLTTLPLGPLPHTVWGPLPVYFFTQRTSLKCSCMLLGDVGCWRPQCMLALAFLAFPFKSLLCQVHPEILKALVHPSGKSSGIESTASNRQHGISCWMRSSRRQSFVRYEWSQSGRPKISTKRQVQCSAPQGYRQQGTKRQSHQCRR